MTPEQQKVFQETRLRNLEKRYSKIKKHACLTDEALKIKKEMDLIKSQLP